MRPTISLVAGIMAGVLGFKFALSGDMTDMLLSILVMKAFLGDNKNV